MTDQSGYVAADSTPGIAEICARMATGTLRGEKTNNEPGACEKRGRIEI